MNFISFYKFMVNLFDFVDNGSEFVGMGFDRLFLCRSGDFFFFFCDFWCDRSEKCVGAGMNDGM